MREVYQCVVCGLSNTRRAMFTTKSVRHGELVCQGCAAMIGQNADSIDAIPRDLLPDGPARDDLMAQAMRGEDLYAYFTNPTWYLWSEARANATAPARNGRVTVVDWLAEWMADHVVLVAV